MTLDKKMGRRGLASLQKAIFRDITGADEKAVRLHKHLVTDDERAQIRKYATLHPKVSCIWMSRKFKRLPKTIAKILADAGIERKF